MHVHAWHFVLCLLHRGIYLVDIDGEIWPEGLCSESGILSFREPLVKTVALDLLVLRELVGSLVSWVSLAPKVPT